MTQAACEIENAEMVKGCCRLRLGHGASSVLLMQDIQALSWSEGPSSMLLTN